MQAVSMSKQVNIEHEILHGNWPSHWKCNEVKLTSCKTDIISNIMQAIPIQCRSRLVRLKKHSNNGFAILHGIKLSP